MELLERRCRLEWMIWGTCRTLIIIIKRKKIDKDRMNLKII
jgi:hypothetical protein